MFGETLLESYRQRRARSLVGIQADGAAESLADKLRDGIPPPYRFNAGHPPGGWSREEFEDRVGALAIRLLARDVPVVPLTYDQEATRQATSEFDAIRHEQKRPPKPGSVIIVFNQA